MFHTLNKIVYLHPKIIRKKTGIVFPKRGVTQNLKLKLYFPQYFKFKTTFKKFFGELSKKRSVDYNFLPQNCLFTMKYLDTRDSLSKFLLYENFFNSSNKNNFQKIFCEL